MLSSSTNPWHRRLYPEDMFRRHLVDAPRSLGNRKASQRTSVAELLVTTY